MLGPLSPSWDGIVVTPALFLSTRTEFLSCMEEGVLR